MYVQVSVLYLGAENSWAQWLVVSNGLVPSVSRKMFLHWRTETQRSFGHNHNMAVNLDTNQAFFC